MVTQIRPSVVTPKPAIGVTTGQPISPPTAQQDRATSACEPYREVIEQGFGRGRNAMAIWQDLVSDHGFPHGYQTVKRFVRKLRGSESRQAVGIILTAVGDSGGAEPGRSSGDLALGGQFHRHLQNWLRPFGHLSDVELLYDSAPSPVQQKLWFRPLLRLLITFCRVVE